MNETDLNVALDRYDRVLEACASGQISFGQFIELYDNFYLTYGLDGHGSSDTERELLVHFEKRIAIHREVWEQILTRVCSDEDAVKPDYMAAGFIGSREAGQRLCQLVSVYLPERRGG